jgi:tetratricopeptide (TPR) repeat protein
MPVPVGSSKGKVGRAPNPVRAQEEKERGNEFFRKKKYKESIICYTRAAEFNPDDATLFSNRSAAYLHLEHYELALRDAERCIDMTPTWVKGYFRKGKALLGQEKFDEAMEAFKQASEIDPSNKEIQDAMRVTQLRMKNRNNPVINFPLTARLNAYVPPTLLGIAILCPIGCICLLDTLILDLFRLVSPMPSSSAASK